jgi:PAS domain S-box-containing protein
MRPEFFRHLFESSRCGILTIDEAGRVTTANQFAREMLQLPQPPVDAAPACTDFLRDHPTLSRTLLDSLSMENPPSRFEVEVRPKGGARRVLGGTISHVRGTNGKREGAVLFFKDLTQIEIGEEQDRLKDRLAAIGQMAAGLAHEIRNPLGNIGSTATLLKRKLNGNDSGIIALDNIVQEVRRLNQTVTQCLEYAKPIHLRPRPVELSVLVTEALQEVRARWPSGKVMVQEKYDPRVSGLIADGIQLRQVFHNLISNAFDAMGGKGNLEIATFLELSEREFGSPGTPPSVSSTPFAVIRIRDDGKGISAEARERLFFPFFTTKPGGSGIGLAIVKKIVDSHQGIIDVESEPDRGAVFSIKLPYPAPPERSPDGADR